MPWLFGFHLLGKAAEILLSRYAAKAADSRYAGVVSVAADADAAYPRSTGTRIKFGACSVI